MFSSDKEREDEYVKQKLEEIHSGSAIARFAKFQSKLPEQKMNPQNIALIIMFLIAIAYGAFSFWQNQAENISPYPTSLRILKLSDVAREILGDDITPISNISYRRYGGNKIYFKVEVQGSKGSATFVSKSEYKAKEGSFLELYLEKDGKKVYLQEPQAPHNPQPLVQEKKERSNV